MTFAVPTHIKQAFSEFHEKWELGERQSIEDKAVTKLFEFYAQEGQLEEEFFQLEEWHLLLNGRFTGELEILWISYINLTCVHHMKLIKARLLGF